MGIKVIFESKLYIVEKDQSTLPDEKLPNVNIRDPSHDKSSDYVCNWVDKPKCIQIS